MKILGNNNIKIAVMYYFRSKKTLTTVNNIFCIWRHVFHILRVQNTNGADVL